MKLAERERENRRLARSLAHATPAIDNRNEDTREFAIMQERDRRRFNGGGQVGRARHNENRAGGSLMGSPRGALDSVQARETAELPDIRASLEVPVVGPPRSMMRPEDERKEAERAEIRKQQAEAAQMEAERVAAAKLERAKERAEQRAGVCALWVHILCIFSASDSKCVCACLPACVRVQRPRQWRRSASCASASSTNGG